MTDQSPSYHYALIARALRVLEAEGPALTLEALAARMGVSAAHFQRVFSAWVGVSPKRYQQYLVLDHARDLLARKFTLLDTALETGLSGPSRLHDLFMTWEAVTPGDVARAGAGLAIDWGWFDSPFGAAIVMGTEKGICGLGFAAEMGEAAAFADLQNRWPLAQFRENPAQLAPWVQTAFGLHRSANAPAPLLLIGMRAFVTDVPQGFTAPAAVLPMQVFLWSDDVQRGFVEKTSAAIMVLMLVLIAMNSLAIYLRNRFERRW